MRDTEGQGRKSHRLSSILSSCPSPPARPGVLPADPHGSDGRAPVMLSSEAPSSLGCGLPAPQELRPSRRAVPLPPAAPGPCGMQPRALSPPKGPGCKRRSRFSALERTGLPPWTADLPAPRVLGGDPQRPPLCTLGSVACICLLTAPQYRLSVPASLGVQPRSPRAQALPGRGGRRQKP